MTAGAETDSETTQVPLSDSLQNINPVSSAVIQEALAEFVEEHKSPSSTSHKAAMSSSIPLPSMEEQRHPSRVSTTSSIGSSDQYYHHSQQQQQQQQQHTNSHEAVMLARASDYTVPTSNAATRLLGTSPPLQILHMDQAGSQQTSPQNQQTSQTNNQETRPSTIQVTSSSNNHQISNHNTVEEDTPPRRNIFGVQVEEKYHTQTDFSHCHPPPPASASSQQEQEQPLTNQAAPSSLEYLQIPAPPSDNQGTDSDTRLPMGSSSPPTHSQLPIENIPDTDEHPAQRTGEGPTDDPKIEEDNNDDEMEVSNGVLVIETQSLTRPGLARDNQVSENTLSDWQSPKKQWKLFTLKPKQNHNNTRRGHHSSTKKHASKNNAIHRRLKPHETIHAQSLLLGLAFCAVWSASNIMAPNLTEMADFFEFDEYQRDLYLGSYCALATGVVSFPIGAGIGILADMVNRKYLYCATLVGGAVAAYATGLAVTFPQLFVARLLTGGFMGGSVPVAFSLLGDLFAVEERNAASSGLTAMMGLGIMLGQVYAGMVGPTVGWQFPFTVSAIVTLIFAVLCLAMVREPERGGKEKALQDMIKSGARYDRKLSWQGFWHSCTQNASNSIILWQGFFSSIPWGIIFVFLNDYLSQERGLSVPAATYLVFLFGIGCAVGGVLGGYWGQLAQDRDRRYLPLFMAATTILGVLPFLGLLNVRIPRAHGTLGILFAVGSGFVASLPSVNVRPCLINVNPPETRGAALTAANLLINLGRGVGPSCVTLLGMYVTRQEALNFTLTVFWAISAVQLVLLSNTLPKDQDAMEAELARYAAMALNATKDESSMSEMGDVSRMSMALTQDPEQPNQTPILLNEQSARHIGLDSSISSMPNWIDEQSVEVSIEERMTSFDGIAVNETLVYVQQGFREFKQELVGVLPAMACVCVTESSSEDSGNSSGEESFEDEDGVVDKNKRKNGNRHLEPIASYSSAASETTEQQHNVTDESFPDEQTPLIV